MKIKPYVVIMATILIGVMGIYAAIGMGIWKTSSNKQPSKFADGELTGQYRADDIRGSYTFGEISKLFNVPLDVLASAFNIEISKAEAFACKDLETVFGDGEIEVGTGSVKIFVAFYLGQPIELEDTFLPQKGAEILIKNGNMTAEQTEYLQSHIVGTQTSINALNTESYSAIEVSGSDYFKDIAKKYDIPLDDITGAFLVPKEKSQYYQVKDLKNDFDQGTTEIGTSSVKMFIAFYKGMNYDLSSTSTYQTATGVQILKSKGKIIDEQLEYLKSHTVEN